MLLCWAGDEAGPPAIGPGDCPLRFRGQPGQRGRAGAGGAARRRGGPELRWAEGNKEEQHPGARQLRTGMLLCWAGDEAGPPAIGPGL